MAKMMPLLDLLMSNFYLFSLFHQFLSIDKSMISCRSFHGAKAMCKRQDSEVWLQDVNVLQHWCYSCNFEIYCGKDPSKKKLLGTHVVDAMLSCVANTN